MSSLCLLLGYSRQALFQYNRNNSKALFEEDLVMQEVLRHRKLQTKLGTRKLLVL